MATDKKDAGNKPAYLNKQVSPWGRANWPKVAQPDEYLGNKSWSINILVEKGDDRKADMEDYMKRALKCAQIKWPFVTGVTHSRVKAAKNPKLIWAPIRDGDASANATKRKRAAKGDDVDGMKLPEEGCWIIRCKSRYDEDKADHNQPKTFIGKEPLPPERIYGGCYCRASVDLATFTGTVGLANAEGDEEQYSYKGVRAQLRGVQFLKDGESFGGAGSGAASPEEFGEVPPDLGVGVDVEGGEGYVVDETPFPEAEEEDDLLAF